MSRLDEIVQLPAWVTSAVEQIDWTTDWARWMRSADALPPRLLSALDANG